MVNYICKNCFKEFKKKDDYIKHTERRKYPCKPITVISPENTTIPPNKFELPPISQNSAEFASKVAEFALDNNEQYKDEIKAVENDIICVHCDKTFTRVDSLRKHQNGRCKVLTHSNQSINQEPVNQVQDKPKSLDKTSNLVNIDELDIDDKTKQILTILLNQNKKIIDEMKSEMDKIKEENKEMKEKIGKINVKKISKTINNNTNNSNNTNSHNTNNTQNNTINNTIIVAHGKEDLDKIELETIMKCLSTIQYKDIIPNMTRHVYINDKKPENKNFCVVDMARNKCKYHDGKKWLIGKTTEKVNRIFDNLHTLLTDPFEKENINKTIEFIRANPKKFNEKWIKISNTYLKNLYDEDDKESVENKLKILEEIKLIFFNNKDEILKIKTIE